MLHFTCLALFVTLSVGLEFQAELSGQWKGFKSAYDKSYTKEEDVKRQFNFKHHVKQILEHNLQHDLGEIPYTLGVNKFSDMEHDEFVRTHLGLKLPANFSTGTNNEIFVPSPNAPTAASLDWRSSGAVTPIKDQGECGSCWTFGVIGALESAYAIKYKKTVPLSEQHLLDCASNSKYGNAGCGGGLLDQAMKYIIDNGGINTQQCYPYTGQQVACKQNVGCKTAKMLKYVDVKRGDENALLQAVNIGPVAVGIDGGQRDFQSYRSGVYMPSYCSQYPNHAVIVVGYGNEGGNDYWLVRNSWGTSWGDNGYVKMARNKGGLCGITTMAIYPVVA